MRTLDLNSLFIRDFLAQAFRRAIPSSLRVLDLGCGLRPYEDLYGPRHAQVVAGDKDSRARAEIVLSADALPFKDSSFDTILLTEVIEHSAQPSAVIAEVARVLAPDGRLYLTWPLVYSMHDIPEDYVRLTEFGMSNLLAESGLEFEMLQRRGDVVAVLTTLLSHIELGLSEFLTRLPVVGRLLVPFRWLAIAISNLTVLAVYHSTRNAARLRPARVGEALSGTNQAALWTLGYCTVVRRRGRAG